MAEIAQALYPVSTAAFALVAWVVGGRLVRLSLRNGEVAERLLGLGIPGTAVLGYAVQGGMRDGVLRGSYGVAFSVIGTYRSGRFDRRSVSPGIGRIGCPESIIRA